MILRSLATTLVTLSLPLASHAQEWDWRVTPFFWAAGIDGDVTVANLESDVDTSFSDILDMLDFAGLVHVEAHQPGYALFADVVYLSMEPDGGTSPLGAEIDVDAESLFAEVGFIWKVFGEGESGIEAGLRYYDQEVTLDTVNIAEIERGKSWTDGFVGFRYHRPLRGAWSFLARANVGAGGSDLAWSLTPMLVRDFEGGNRFILGLRRLDVDYEDETENGLAFSMDVSYSGLVVGYTFN